jgi:hypothetical protein
MRVACEPGTLVSATNRAPRSFAASIAHTVSIVSPDCEMPATRTEGSAIGSR